jgi:glucan phosphoethanolaminetransferase (alkaline phosphatase superfamily)
MAQKEKRGEWLRDVDARQRNVVFPDTAANEARFWRNLYEGKQPLTTTKIVFLVVFAIIVLVLLIALPFSWGNEIYNSLTTRIVSATLEVVFALCFLGCFLLLVKWGTQRRK